MAVVQDLLQIDALAPVGPYRSIRKTIVTDVRGDAVGELSLVPVPYVARTLSSLRKAPSLSIDARLEALRRAGQLFLSGVYGGLDRAEYEREVCRVSGLSMATVQQAAQGIASACASAYERALAGRPAGAVDSLSDPRVRDGSGLWIRRGVVFGVHAAGNHPAVHMHWLEALALGYRLAVRPSRREPLTPFRLISALRDAGFSEQIAFLPGEYDAADEMLRGADLSMAYGGEDVMTKYGARSDVLPQGPGRSKIVITRGADWRDHLDLIVDSASRGGGTGCTNATAVFVDGDARALAEAVAGRLAQIPTRKPEDGDAVLPVVAVETARAINDFLQRSAASSESILGGDTVVDELGDGSAALRPAVHLVDNPSSKALRVELGFPCLWITAWTPEDGLSCFDDTLALTVLGADDLFVEELLSRPTIRNVYDGAHPTYWSAPGMPHDDYLATFLMEVKGVIR